MATRDELYTALRNADASGDAAGASKLAAYIQNLPSDVTATAAPVNKDYQAGKAESNPVVRGLTSVINGPLMGFGDEVLGGIGGLYDTATKGGNLSENYRANRDHVRGIQDQYAADFPVGNVLVQAAASAPLGAIKWGAGAVQAAKPVNLLERMLASGKTAAAYGAVGGAGNSTSDDLAGVLKDSALSAGTSAVIGSAVLPVAGAVNAIGGNIKQRVSQSSAADYAKQKVAEALVRDARGTVVQSGVSNPVNQVAARFTKLGDEATVADAGGRSTNQLLDTLATLPGQAKDSVEQLIHQRQAGRAGRLITAAEDGLSTQGQRLTPNIEQWTADRATASAPLYDQVRKIDIQPSGNLSSVVQAADDIGALGEARKMATANQQRFGLDPANPQSWNMGDLDQVKQGLDQLIAKQWDAVGGKLTPLGTAYQGLKSRLVKELDTATTNPQTGESIYKAARDAYAGPSAIIDAANKGRLALSKDGAAISGITGDLSASEMQAFRLGAFESLRSKLGKESGQTEILKMWKEPATREKLLSIFGDEGKFRQFAADVARESRLKGLESVGRGSQTASRQFAAGDLDMSALADAGGALASAKTGNLMGAVGAAQNAWNRVATPEPVRNQIAKLLLSQGGEGKDNINQLAGLLQHLNEKNALISRGSGLVGSQIGSRLGAPMQVPQR